MFKVILLTCLVVIAVGLVAACTDVGYYAQCVTGHLDVMRRCRPISDLLVDPAVPEDRRLQLTRIKAVRDFASTELALPENDSYRHYADLERPYVVWNVVAAPELSLEPKQWCFPVAGCVSYRGYFDKEKVAAEADALKGKGYDVDVYGVQAYSTLNWFDDPVLNTFIDGPELNAAALVFHELAHQVVYVKDDSRFNEAFARTVEIEGIRRWLLQYGTEGDWEKYQVQSSRSAAFQGMLAQARSRLKTLYDGSIPETEKRLAKARILAETVDAYDDLKRSWGGYAGYDNWMARGLNNARLASLATYHDLVPAFQGLLASVNGDLSAFYRKVGELAALSSTERLARLDDYRLKHQAQLPPAIH